MEFSAESELISLQLTDSQFKEISQLVYRLCGIMLPPGKEALVKARLMKRLRALGLTNFDDYIRFVEKEGTRQELNTMIDVLTTNKTSFFRENQHFDFLKNNVLPNFKSEAQRIRFWSAGCSSGEEPFSLAVLLREELPNIDRQDIKILATDISTRMLTIAKEAIYEEEKLQEIPPQLIKKYFTSVRGATVPSYRANESIRSLIQLAKLNLMEEWPMRGPFDVIFCRNVMIYFDRPTREKLINRFWGLLKPGGYLLVGHSESLTSFPHQFRYVQPAVYIK